MPRWGAALRRAGADQLPQGGKKRARRRPDGLPVLGVCPWTQVPGRATLADAPDAGPSLRILAQGLARCGSKGQQVVAYSRPGLFEVGHCLDAVRHLHRELGKVPTAEDYERFASDSGVLIPA